VNDEFKKLKGADFKGDVSYPEIIIGSYPWMGLSMEIDVRSDHFKRRLLDEVVGLSSMGADLIAVACNTTQVYEPDISSALRQTESEFCGLAEIVRRWLISRPQETQVFVAGIGHVTKDTEFSAFRFLHECQSVVLPSDELSEAIIDLAFEVKQFGPTSKTNQKLRSILNRSGCSHALLLLTELSMVLGEFPRISSSGIQVVDALDLYAKELAICLLPSKSPSNL
jgi:aspartate/glutamate racemase